MTDSVIPFPRRDETPPDLIFALKGEAHRLRADALAQGRQLSHGAALEELAHSKGFRSWNALNAHVAEGGAVAISSPAAYPWQLVSAPLPTLPMRVTHVSERALHASITELFRWARQLDFIADNIDDRAEMLEMIGGRMPYVLEQSRSRWPDGLFHLCDRGYEEFKRVAFSLEQLERLGLPAWNDEYGQHGGNDSFTLIGDEWRYTRKALVLKRTARLLASLALEADGGSVSPAVSLDE
jgi:hypothetical protein